MLRALRVTQLLFHDMNLKRLTIGNLKSHLGGDFGTSSWLPPGTSALFAVTVPHSQTAKVYLEYKYEWEFTSAIAMSRTDPSIESISMSRS